jgi:hypothetical protein
MVTPGPYSAFDPSTSQFGPPCPYRAPKILSHIAAALSRLGAARVWLLPALVCLALLVWPIKPAKADMLYLNNGEEYIGDVVSITQDKVVFRTAEKGKLLEFAKKEIERIEISTRREGWDAKKLQDLKDPLLRRLLEKTPVASEYPQAGYVNLYEEVALTINPDGSARETTRLVRKVLRERGKKIATDLFYYIKDRERLRINFARTVLPGGNLQHLSDNAIEDASVNADEPKYENLRKLKFALKEVTEESVVDVKVTREIARTDPLHPLLLEEPFRYEEPILRKRLVITVPPGMAINFQNVRFREGQRLSIAWDPGGTRYIWEGGKAPEIVEEPDMPPEGDFVPKVVAAPASSWAAIGRACTAEQNGKRRYTPELEQRITALIKGKANQEEKLKAIYSYVAREIRRVPVPPEDYSYRPKELGEIYKNCMGNSLDKAFLFQGMLERAGIKAFLVWIRPRSEGSVCEEVPSLGQLTVPLVAVPAGSAEFRFFSPALDTVGFGNLPADYQQTRGLLIDGSRSRLVDVRCPEPQLLANRYEMSLAVDGGMSVEKSAALHGDHAIALRELKDRKPEEMKRHFEEMVAEVHPNAVLSRYEVSDLKDLCQPVTARIRYRIPGYALRGGEDLLVFQVPEIDYSAYSVGRAQREHPLDWGKPRVTRHQAVIRLPAGYRIYYLPEGVSIDAAPIRYRARFKAAEGTIEFRDEYRREAPVLPARRYADYKRCLETMAGLAKERIVLEKMK